MDNFDPAMEQRVWQRIRGEQQPQSISVEGLAAAAQDEAAVYLMLSRQMQGPEKNMLRRLFSEEQTHGVILRGIHTTMTGQRLTLRTIPPKPETPDIALKKCYARTLKAMAEYESRANDKEFGAVFAQLLQQERAHCAIIMQLLGSR